MTPDSSVPIVTQAGPTRVAAGGTGFTLRVNGSNLSSRSVVRWNGAERPTTFVSTNFLRAEIAAEDVAREGIAQVTVFTPGANGGSSRAFNVLITSDNESCFRPRHMAVEPTGRFAFVIDGGCSDENSGFIRPYAVDPSSGGLVRDAARSLSIGPRNTLVAVEPRGRYVYVAHAGGAAVARLGAFAIDADTGELTPVGTTGGLCPDAPGGECFPTYLSFEPSGRFAYAVSLHRAPDTALPAVSIATLSIDPASGALRLRDLTTSGGAALPLRVHPLGRFAYRAASSETGGAPYRIVTHSLDPENGALKVLGSTSALQRPNAIGFDPSGRLAIVANAGSNDLETFSIDPATGALASVGQIGTARTPDAVLVHPSGRFAYVVSPFWLEVWTYTLDASSGQLASIGSIAALPYVDGDSSIAMALHPTGNFAYVVLQTSEIQVYDVDADSGALRKSGSVAR